MPRADFEIAPGIRLSVSGADTDVRHFLAEYQPTQVEPAPGLEPAVDVAFVRRFEGSALPHGLRGRHKTVGWSMALSSADDGGIRADVLLTGRPAAFARSLVQGYYVEPLLSIAAAEHGYVQLPAAGIVNAVGLHVLIGRSRAGKSTIATRALAAGDQILGDDQVLLSADGGWRPFPRRLRLYPDIRQTASAAWRRLRGSTRAVLTGRRFVATVTRAFVRPSLAVDVAELGGQWDATPRRATRVVLIERSSEVTNVQIGSANAAAASTWAQAILAEQRAKLRRLDDAAWAARIEAAEVREAEILAEALAGIAIRHVRIPEGWPAARAIEATAGALQLG